MGITKEDFEKVFDILKDRTPEFQITFVATDLINENFEFRLCFRGFIKSETFIESISEAIAEMEFKLQKQKALNEVSDDYLRILISELEKSIDTFEKINVRGKEFYFQKSAKIYLHEPEREYYEIDNVEEQYFNEIVAISNTRFEYCNNLKSSIEEIISTNPEQNAKKMKLKLSVSDIGLLFRLLDEEGLIEYKHKTEIFRFISQNLKTSKQDLISTASVRNKFNTPELSAIDKLDPILVNLRQHIKKILK